MKTTYCIIVLIMRNFKDILIKDCIQLYKTLVSLHIQNMLKCSAWAPRSILIIIYKLKKLKRFRS